MNDLWEDSSRRNFEMEYQQMNLSGECGTITVIIF